MQDLWREGLVLLRSSDDDTRINGAYMIENSGYIEFCDELECCLMEEKNRIVLEIICRIIGMYKAYIFIGTAIQMFLNCDDNNMIPIFIELIGCLLNFDNLKLLDGEFMNKLIDLTNYCDLIVSIANFSLILENVYCFSFANQNFIYFLLRIMECDFIGIENQRSILFCKMYKKGLIRLSNSLYLDLYHELLLYDESQEKMIALTSLFPEDDLKAIKCLEVFVGMTKYMGPLYCVYSRYVQILPHEFKEYITQGFLQRIINDISSESFEIKISASILISMIFSKFFYEVFGFIDTVSLFTIIEDLLESSNPDIVLPLLSALYVISESRPEVLIEDTNLSLFNTIEGLSHSQIPEIAEMANSILEIYDID